MAEYASEVVLLRKRFKATPTEGLEAKRVKFQELADCPTIHCPDKKYRPKSVSTAVKVSLSKILFEKGGKIQALWHQRVT